MYLFKYNTFYFSMIFIKIVFTSWISLITTDKTELGKLNLVFNTLHSNKKARVNWKIVIHQKYRKNQPYNWKLSWDMTSDTVTLVIQEKLSVKTRNFLDSGLILKLIKKNFSLVNDHLDWASIWWSRLMIIENLVSIIFFFST